VFLPAAFDHHLVPGTSVTANPGSKLVSVEGSADIAAIRAAITAAGYTPSAELVG